MEHTTHATNVVYRCSKKCESKVGYKVTKRVQLKYHRLTRPDRFGNERTVGRLYINANGSQSRYFPTVYCDHCQKPMQGNEIEGKVNTAVTCDVRCTSAVGHKCECSCGGANHGADHNA